MTNTLIGLLGAGVIAVGGWAAAAGLGDSDPARTVSLPAATTTAGDTTTQATTTVDSTTTVATTTSEDEAGDISGPCDEAEHANDPRCTGAPVTTDDDRDGDDDRSGSNRGSDGDDSDSEDRSGSNSGKG
jgi:hypothetical protein